MNTAAAFFDVDETLIGFKTMFRFLAFHLERRGAAPGTYERLTATLHRAAADGAPRAEVNRRYYRLYAGESAASLAASGRAWFTHELAGAPFVPAPTARFDTHRRNGDLTVLVSGSFFACLDPIAEHLGADRAFGTRPVIRDGLLTGEVVTPLIGATKGRTAHAVAAIHGLDLAHCSAYGDHSSDLDLLRAVGHPVVVGSDPVLTAHAQLAGWERLPDTPAAVEPRYQETRT
ncbi:HAD family hydrolase [Streptomyces sp. NPDC048331]|uniref:HAD family hydrolase n=1 Tax=Streptomyces sp. NPDC048331 TaxID=3365534 RepID=UPI0037224DBE